MAQCCVQQHAPACGLDCSCPLLRNAIILSSLVSRLAATTTRCIVLTSMPALCAWLPSLMTMLPTNAAPCCLQQVPIVYELHPAYLVQLLTL